MAELFSEDIELDLLNVKRQPQNITSVTPEQARQLSIINQMSSSIPPSVMVNAAEKNVDMGMIDLLSEFFGKAKEASYGKVKKAIFNQFNVFKTIHDLTKPGGFIFHQLPGQGYYDHGFYNYQPTFFFDLAEANDYSMIGFWMYDNNKFHIELFYVTKGGFLGCISCLKMKL